jgi:predicted nuclease of predicted toxin-antitoxin system
MKIYLDDNTTDPRLASELRKRGHEVAEPSDASLAGASDARHFLHAIEQGLAILTRDAEDFRNLHRIVVAAAGRHPGILVVRFDNDPGKDLKPGGMAAAVDRIEASGLSLINQLFILNHWRK